MPTLPRPTLPPVATLSANLAARLERARASAKGARDAAAGLGTLIRRDGPGADDDGHALTGMHWLTAGLFVAGGAQAVLIEPSAGRRVNAAVHPLLRVARIAPLVAAPLVGAAHVAHALRPGRPAREAAKAADSLAIAVSAAAAAAGIYRVVSERSGAPRWRGRRRAPLLEWLPAMAPIGFGMTGLFGLILGHDERKDAEVRARLARRASLTDRLLPRRGGRQRLERIVIQA